MVLNTLRSVPPQTSQIVRRVVGEGLLDVEGVVALGAAVGVGGHWVSVLCGAVVAISGAAERSEREDARRGDDAVDRVRRARSRGTSSTNSVSKTTAYTGGQFSIEPSVLSK